MYALKPSITFGELFELYFTRYAMTRMARPDNAKHCYDRHAKMWQAKPLAEITKTVAQNWVDDIGAFSGQHAANRAAAVMCAVFNWGISRGHCTENPFTNIEKFSVQSRDRFLQPDELKRFKTALEMEEPIIRDVFWLLLFTGARRGNVLSMRWDQVDFDLATWKIPKAKNGESHVIPLTTPALAVLIRRSRTADGQWVFPSKKTSQHIVEIRRPWRRILKRAGIQNLRIHDLRRTVGSYMAMNGENAYTIAAALGHKDQRSTAVYARLNVTSVRRSLQAIQEQWL